MIEAVPTWLEKALVAVTVKVPRAVAVKRPVLLMLPPPERVQVTPWLAVVTPVTKALNWAVPPTTVPALAGLTLTVTEPGATRETVALPERVGAAALVAVTV